MKIDMFAIRDTKVAGFMPPFCARSEGEAVRMFQEMFRDPNTLLHKYPDDFSLYLVGAFDSDSGAVDGCLPVLKWQASAFATLLQPD